MRLEVLARAVRKEKEVKKKKNHPNWKGRSKIIAVAHMILHTENPKNFTHTQKC